MNVQKSRLVLHEDEARIVAQVSSEAGHFTPFDLMIGVPRAFVGWLDLTGSPFVPTLLLLAATLGERLRLEGTVSPRLLENTQKASELFRSWWGFEPVSVEAEACLEERPRGQGSGLFFTRGVDSWHSALRDRTREDPGHLTHLLYAPDFDRQYSPARRRRALALTREAAAGLGLPLVPISHNGRELVDRFINWEFAHGGVLAGIGLALGGWFADVHRASCIDINHLIPWGSSPDLDPLWSTERTTTRLEGVEVARTDKVRAIAASQDALERLKVCWREDIDTNCGRCDKCLRTQIALEIAGALQRAPVFVAPLSVRSIMDLPALVDSDPRNGQEVLWSELCESFPDEPRLAELRFAACRRLPARHPLSTAQQDRCATRIVIEARAHAAAFLLPAPAADLLPAPLSRGDSSPEARTPGRHVEMTWTTPAPGRIPMPLRPTRSMAPELLAACRDPLERPNHWCMIAFASRETARLLLRLSETWGQGITCLTRDGRAGGDHGVSPLESSLIQRSSDIRLWWGPGDYLDPFLVLESLKHGCLPLQCVPEASHDDLAASLPAGLAQFTLAIPENGPVAPITAEERAARLDRGLSVMLSGNLERDLAQMVHSLS